MIDFKILKRIKTEKEIEIEILKKRIIFLIMSQIHSIINHLKEKSLKIEKDLKILLLENLKKTDSRKTDLKNKST